VAEALKFGLIIAESRRDRVMAVARLYENQEYRADNLVAGENRDGVLLNLKFSLINLIKV